MIFRGISMDVSRWLTENELQASSTVIEEFEYQR